VRLSTKTLSQLPGGIDYPAYCRDGASGIVHFGIGAFHRAHQASCTDMCLNAGENGWTITGVSMRSPTVASQLNPQDGLYTLTERTGDLATTRVIGSVARVMVAGRERNRIIAALADPACRIVSFTVTEKGYCRSADGSLDMALAAEGFYPLVGEAMAMRRQAGLPGVTLLSCDNLAANGKQLGRLMHRWLDEKSSGLATWFASECASPDSMVDRIVPATTEDDLTELEARIGLRDEGAVFTEPFSQWVIEDRFAGPRPGWEHHGAQIVPDVTPYETAKLRMLNGAHSLLAYCGLDAGFEFVHQAIGDPNLRRLVTKLMREEAAPTITAGPEQDLASYADQLVARFENPALNHRLIQIAMDGSQKIPQRWLETLAWHARRGQSCVAILAGIAHWLKHVRGDERKVEDPMADSLRKAWHVNGKDGIVSAMFGPDGLIASDWQPSAAERDTIRSAITN